MKAYFFIFAFIALSLNSYSQLSVKLKKGDRIRVSSVSKVSAPNEREYNTVSKLLLKILQVDSLGNYLVSCNLEGLEMDNSREGFESMRDKVRSYFDTSFNFILKKNYEIEFLEISEIQVFILGGFATPLYFPDAPVSKGMVWSRKENIVGYDFLKNFKVSKVTRKYIYLDLEMVAPPPFNEHNLHWIKVDKKTGLIKASKYIANRPIQDGIIKQEESIKVELLQR
ncbi:MAG: hypothetical protein SFU27_13965 [Thermonemataceae bacterium]|nr:hypothetical protein [Thermonemataceae bacterium]